MKKILYLIILTALFSISCQKDVSVSPPDVLDKNIKLIIDSNPQGAKIYIDEKYMGQATPDTIEWVQPGNHLVKLKLELYKDTSVIVNVTEDDINILYLDYTINPSMLGRFYIESKPPGAEIYLDSINTTLKTPSGLSGIVPGKHKIKLKLRGYWDLDFEETVTAGNVTYLNETMNDTSVWINYKQTTVNELPTNYYSSIAIQYGYIKWIGGSQEGGLIRYDDNEWKVFNTSNSPIPSNTITSIFIKGDDVWIGTDNGAAHYNNGIWQIYNPSNTPMPTGLIECIYVDNLNKVWFGTYNKGVFVLDGGSWIQYNKNNTPMTSDFIKSILVEPNGSFWIGTNGYGLIQFDGIDWRITNNESIPESQTIRDIYIDGFSNVWIACPSRGVDTGGVAQRTNNVWKIFYTGIHSLTPKDPAAGMNVMDMEPDQQGNLWFASYEFGMVRYDGSFKIFSQNNSKMFSNKVNSIAIDGQGHKWLTTYGEGIIKYKGN